MNKIKVQTVLFLFSLFIACQRKQVPNVASEGSVAAKRVSTEWEMSEEEQTEFEAKNLGEIPSSVWLPELSSTKAVRRTLRDYEKAYSKHQIVLLAGHTVSVTYLGVLGTFGVTSGPEYYMIDHGSCGDKGSDLIIDVLPKTKDWGGWRYIPDGWADLIVADVEKPHDFTNEFIFYLVRKLKPGGQLAFPAGELSNKMGWLKLERTMPADNSWKIAEDGREAFTQSPAALKKAFKANSALLDSFLQQTTAQASLFYRPHGFSRAELVTGSKRFEFVLTK